MQVTRVIFLLLCFIQDALVLASTKKSFAQKLYGVGIAHQRLQQSQMLDHLAASTSTGTVSPPIPSAILAAAATTFQIYTSDALPTSPAPPSACANALTAGLNCDPSIQLMALVSSLKFYFKKEANAFIPLHQCKCVFQFKRPGNTLY
jgi:microcystin-dependent protein